MLKIYAKINTTLNPSKIRTTSHVYFDVLSLPCSHLFSKNKLRPGLAMNVETSLFRRHFKVKNAMFNVQTLVKPAIGPAGEKFFTPIFGDL